MGADAHIDDTGLLLRGGVGADIVDAVEDTGIVHGGGHEDNVGAGGDAAVGSGLGGAAATAGGDACHVGAVGLVGLAVAGGEDGALGGELAAVVVACGGAAGGGVLVPDTFHTVGGAVGAVEGGMAVLESDVDDAHDYPCAVVAMGQVLAIVDGVDAQDAAGVAECGTGLGSHVEPGAEARLGKGLKGLEGNEERGVLAVDGGLADAVGFEGLGPTLEGGDGGDGETAVGTDKAVFFDQSVLVEVAGKKVGQEEGTGAGETLEMERGLLGVGNGHVRARGKGALGRGGSRKGCYKKQHRKESFHHILF